MITIFDLLPLFCAIWGVRIFGSLGNQVAGFNGVLVGVAVGGCCGWFVGKLPFRLCIAWSYRDLKRSDTTALKQRLNSQYFISHLILAELMSRGEPVRDYRDYIVSLLNAESSDKRRFGWANFKVWFPEEAEKISDFHPNDSVADCRKKLASLRTEHGSI